MPSKTNPETIYMKELLRRWETNPLSEISTIIHAMLTRTGDVHGYGTRSVRGGLAMTTGDHQLVGYRVPKEWATLSEDRRGVGSLVAFKRGSRGVPGRVPGLCLHVCWVWGLSVWVILWCGRFPSCSGVREWQEPRPVVWTDS